jgi:hypothetical protein
MGPARCGRLSYSVGDCTAAALRAVSRDALAEMLTSVEDATNLAKPPQGDIEFFAIFQGRQR